MHTEINPERFVVGTEYDDTKRAKGMDAPLAAQTGRATSGIAIPPALMVETPRRCTSDPMGRPAEGSFLTTLRGTDATALKGTTSGLDEPIGTVSAGGIHHALITGKTMGFLESHYSTGENVRGMDEAMGALSCTDRHGLVHGERPPLRVEDLYFRMLKAHEVKAGMAFAADYVVLGNQREQVKQLGNAVTPPVMEMLIERCVQSLM